MLGFAASETRQLNTTANAGKRKKSPDFQLIFSRGLFRHLRVRVWLLLLGQKYQLSQEL
jgi:hypothetical protein